MSKYKILSVIEIDGAKNEDDAVNLLEHLLYVWDEQKTTWKGWGKSKIDIRIKSVTKE